MILVDRKTFAGVPMLWIEGQGKNGKPLPLVIFWHGWTSAKEHNLHYAYLLAEEGYRVMLPDACGHGERADELDEKKRQVGFWEVVIKSIEETRLIKEKTDERGLIKDRRIGLAGTSMGGVITLGSLSAFKWIKTGVSLMGNPYFKKFAEGQLGYFKKQGFDLPYSVEELSEMMSALDDYDLGAHPDRLGRRPLMFWHGQKDPVVPYASAREFYEKVKPDYTRDDDGDDLLFISDENAGHKVSRQGLLAMVDWTHRYL
ncbi:hypothetical protein EV207_10862 [Scopulibacillus darangshiensis]|uniref:Peptidase S9 prolyl oligopeptidase catalytic domain-containing protein n=1 Tax=Scopulibacillus darangshiensis TaxID=442528 RepID=A0A4R2P4M6_9BACL|nr:alpha/beta hydrolase [Scopulibacillus darangshiensis]TCP29770.1 hypothetical protein EV207_10862 [Scopulibacillus darangshiensis]